MNRKKIFSQGMSLIELIIVIAISSVVLIAIVSSIRLVYRGNRFALEQADSIRSARVGVERMVQDMRESAYSDIGDYPIISYSDNSFTFFSDIDRDASIERVRYFIDGGNLKRGILESAGDPPVYNDVNEVVSVVSTNVRNITLGTSMFSFFDKNGTEIMDTNHALDVAFVSVRLIVNINPLRAPDDLEIRSSASLRNVNSSR